MDDVGYDVVVERVRPRQLAAAQGTVYSRAELGARIIGLLDKVWPVLREQHVKTGSNVVVYFDGSPLRIAAGVEVPDGFQPTDIVHPVSTPAGEVAMTTHWGEYTKMQGAYAALERWCAENNRPPAGIRWEVYGDWHADPAQVRTDVIFLLREVAGRQRVEGADGSSAVSSAEVIRQDRDTH